MSRKSCTVSVRKGHLVADLQRRFDPGLFRGIEDLTRTGCPPFGEIFGIAAEIFLQALVMAPVEPVGLPICGFPISRNQFHRFADPVHYGVTAILQRFHIKQVISHNRKCLKVISRLAGVSLPAARRPPSEAPACQRTIRSEISIFILVTPFILSSGPTGFPEGDPGSGFPAAGKSRDFKERGSSPYT